MKRIILIITAMMLILTVFATQQNIRLDSGRTSTELLRGNNNGLEIGYDIADLNWFGVETPKGTFVEIGITGFTHTSNIGAPKLPMERKIIEVPLNAEVVPSVNVLAQKTITLSEYGISAKIIPAQAPVPKSADPSTLEFIINQKYYTQTQEDYEIVKVHELGILRNARLFAVDYYPVSYNPVNGELTIITEAEVDIAYLNGDMDETMALKARTASSVFDNLIDNTVFFTLDARTTLNRYPLGYIIITPNSFLSTLQPFINWKTEQGFNVTVGTTETIGTSTTAIANFISGIWNSATTENPAPSYLLIVGDVAQVPAYNGATGTHITDLNYVKLQGNDYMPEMYFGRFSAQNINQLQPQVDKTLMYEKYLMPDPSYLDNVTLIAGVDSNYGSSHANGAINYATNNYFNTAHGLDVNAYLYPSSGNQETSIIQDVSNGVGYINYTAHGDNQEWYDPQFNNNDVNGLTNSGKYTVAVGNCCLTNHFQTDTCFGEAWLRAADKGAVIYIGGTNSTYWDEDYWWAVGNRPISGSGTPWTAGHIGVYDAMFHEHGEVYSDWTTTAGSITVMGNLAVVEGNGDYNYYWEIYSIMGDPSLNPYIGVPATNAISAPAQIFIGQQSMDVVTSPYCYVSLTKNGEILAAGLADNAGAINLTFDAITEACDVKIVSTGYGYQPSETIVQVIPNNGPYLNVPGFMIDQATSVNAGTTALIDLTIANIGNQDVSNVTATLSTTDPYITITNNICSIAAVTANGEVSLDDAFEIVVSSHVPDEHNLRFNISMGDHNNLWQSNVTLTAFAPAFALSNMVVTDNSGDGMLDAGEGATINFVLVNSGHMVANQAVASFIVNNPEVTVASESINLGNLPTGINTNLSFPIQLSGSFDAAALVFGVSVVAECGSFIDNYLIPVGLSGDNFETGDFGTLNWAFAGNSNWLITSSESHGGTYSAKSGTIGNNQVSTLNLNANLPTAGEVSFWYKVSSESNYDWLEFYDGTTRINRWSGETGWAQFTYSASAGNHNFSWRYDTDWSTLDGQNAAFIDDLLLPGGATGGTNMPIFFCNTETVEFIDVTPNVEYSRELLIQNAGNETLTGYLIMPDGFTLNQSQNFTIEGGESLIFLVKHTAVEDENLEEVITVNSNDTFYPSHSITLHVEAATGNEENYNLPIVTALNGNYPNPFNPETTIAFSLKEAGNVKIEIYNIKGQRINTLVNEVRNAGNHSIVWKGTDSDNRNVASGVYFYRMESQEYTNTKKMLLMK
ncbi:MAG: T9SS type A sorting domain-containing protein [Candidatus Cloacimonetes bacterium]|nr:T9SS type A sorting domain-containing protein [Candidatus Cloacimonadota bacterium]